MPKEKPNIMIIMADQQRADFFAGQGFEIDTMPFLEGLMPRGVWFKNAYTSMPICIPARISMLTGRYAKAHGVIANWAPLAPRYGRDLIDVLKEEGYELALFGKNHSHATRGQFDVWRHYSHTSGIPRDGKEKYDAKFDLWMVQLAHWISEERTPFPLEYQYPVRIVSDAIRWLDEMSHKKPFFAWVSFPEPHSPYQVPEPYFDMFPPNEVPKPAAGPEVLPTKNYQWQFQYHVIKHYHPDCDEKWGRYRSNYCGMLRLIDDQVKRLILAVEEGGFLEDTIIVYLSDHGEFCGDYGLYRKGLGLPQCSIRIPMFWFGGPIRPHQGYHPAHVSIVDVFPTLCEALGVGIPECVQGRSLWPILMGKPYSEREFSSVYVEHGIGGRVLTEENNVGLGAEADAIYVDGRARTNYDGTQVATSGYRRAIVKGRWKLIYDADLPLEIYDLDEDPLELNDLARKGNIYHVKEELMEELLYWSIRLDDNLGVRRYSIKMPSHNWHR
ncbi:MAG: sulfatase family protein [bacterium]